MVFVTGIYNLVCEFYHSIIVECCKGKQTNLDSLSQNNQILTHIHPIAYNNIYSLTLNGKGIAIIFEMDFNRKILLEFARK